MPGLFITGTDTGVGKTYVTILLAEYLSARGLDIGVMKPLSTGSRSTDDARYLRKRLKLKDPLELINPIHLKPPLAPYTAAKLQKGSLKLQMVFKAYKKLEQNHDFVLVEGIGGVMVPIKKGYFVIDLIKELKLPTIIVVRAGLGTINHTLLTIEALKHRKVEILGIILNGYKGKDLSEKTNAKIIKEIGKVRILAKIPLKS